MIKKLRRKFVLVSTLSVFIMLVIVLFSVNLFNFTELTKKSDNLIEMIVQNNGILPKPDKKNDPPIGPDNLPREAMFDTRFFVVYYGTNNVILGSSMENIYSVTPELANHYALQIINGNKNKGFVDGYKYLRTTISGISAIVFVDSSRDIDMAKNFLYNSGYISLSALALVILFSFLFSSRAVKPIATAYEKQKKFITNASHEIKTPLTVISANVDIIEMVNGESKWITSSKEQIQRLTELVNSLVALSKMDEDYKIDKTQFNLSETIETVAKSYNSMALLQQKEFTYTILPKISYLGNEKNINQLFYILLDNAFKYSNDNATISLDVKLQKNKIYCNISNSVDDMKKGNYTELFDRFYRLDESRNSKTGGYGIGLALAQSIVEKHSGKISAFCDTDNIFTIEVIL